MDQFFLKCQSHDSKESERHHSVESPVNGAHPSTKTNRDHLRKDNLGHYCPKIFEVAKGEKQKWCRWDDITA